MILPARNAHRDFTSFDCSLQKETEMSDSKESWPWRRLIVEALRSPIRDFARRRIASGRRALSRTKRADRTK